VHRIPWLSADAAIAQAARLRPVSSTWPRLAISAKGALLDDAEDDDGWAIPPLPLPLPFLGK